LPGQGAKRAQAGPGYALALADCTEPGDESLIGLARFDGEARQSVPVVGTVEGGVLVDCTGEEASSKWAVRHEADANLLTDGEDLVLWASPPQRVLALDGGNRLDGVRAADRLRASLGKAEVPDLALPDQVLDRASRSSDMNVLLWVFGHQAPRAPPVLPGSGRLSQHEPRQRLRTRRRRRDE
jgi:hypothetical protein